MSREPAFLSVDDVLAVHARVIREFGGAMAVRDSGLLESAVALPMARFGGSFLHAGIKDMAAAYLFHLCSNHPFVDGNKRTALAAAETFLLLNGFRLRASDPQVETLVLDLAAGRTSKAAVVRWFRAHARRERH